ncbi:hypothetical protein CMI37_09155 [Candidatus Pacearchaeota archaeon]|nr:hypothetical protein [Candidatus Pacearchaeota archaeon]|tara:strand:- start:1609 stop:2337 length:729 start_codon:yes stop_codon:yes gene_type:complete
MANKLFYGDGSCSIEGSDIRGVEISYEGRVDILDKTPEHYIVTYTSNKIFAIYSPFRARGTIIGPLNDLFDYNGSLKIISVKAVDNSPTYVRMSIVKVMDYAELINTNAEDMTINSEKLKTGYYSNKILGPKPLKQSIGANINTSDGGMVFYLEDGTEYNGLYHVHLNKGMKHMTGGEHTETSQDLYYKDSRSKALLPVKWSNIKNEMKPYKQKRIIKTSDNQPKGRSGLAVREEIMRKRSK